jgi:hypothetical protein
MMQKKSTDVIHHGGSMKKSVKAIAGSIIVGALLLPLSALAADQDLQKKVDDLSKEIEALKHEVQKTEEKSLGRWLEIGGDYRFRFDSLRGGVPAFFSASPFFPGPQAAFDVKNDSLYTNRFGLNLKAKATQDVTVTARLLMYKVAGAQDDRAIQNGSQVFSFDRAGLFDGTIGHVPGDGQLVVDRVYATWNNIGGEPVWFSIGRRPSTGGVPSHLKQDNEKPGNSGVPAILVDYAFDGMTLGWAPDIDALPGAYLKLCYGRGFQNNITNTTVGNGLRNTDMFGINLVPYETDALRAELQYNRGLNIFDSPILLTGPFGPNGTVTAGSPVNPASGTVGFAPTTNIGDIDWYAIDFLGKVKKVGPGDLNWFLDGALSVTHPNNNFALGQAMGLLWTFDPTQPDFGKRSKTGWAIYAGGRYDFTKTGTKVGFEYNYGSKDWITFTPAADDIWTSKLGTRGSVYEAYVIQELPLKPISSFFSKTFFKVGYQYYDFVYTGSNSWLGSPIAISQLNPFNMMQAQLTTPMKKAQDIYATFEVHF